MTTQDSPQAVKLLVLEELIQEVESSLRQCRRTLEGLQQRIAIEERQKKMLQEKRNALAHATRANEPELDFGTTADIVAKVLFERGEPMRVREILQSLADFGLANGDHDRLRNNVISTLTRREDIFDRVSRGIYALRVCFDHNEQKANGVPADHSTSNRKNADQLALLHQ